jgi:hypothetical protein
MARIVPALGVCLLLLGAPGSARAGVGPRLAAAPAANRIQQSPGQAAPDYLFPSAAGMLLFHVRAARAQDFERVVGRLLQVLDSTADPVRKAQAAGWRVFRSLDASPDEAMYIFMFDPAVPQADYDPVKIIGEAIPLEVQGLYERLRGDVIRVERIGLAKIR